MLILIVELRLGRARDSGFGVANANSAAKTRRRKGYIYRIDNKGRRHALVFGSVSVLNFGDPQCLQRRSGSSRIVATGLVR